MPKDEDLLDVEIAWRGAASGPDFLYAATIGGRRYKIRMNDFPAEPLYTLLCEDEELFHIDDWPRAWMKPAPPTAPHADAIKRVFDAHFASYGLALPEECLRKSAGELEQNGWSVDYRFGVKNDDAYVDVFATHRMTNDRLYRIHADGRVDDVGSSTEGVLESSDREFYAEVERRLGRRPPGA